MATPLKGTSGTVTHNGTGMTWVSEWEATPKVSAAKQGPYIGDANEYDVGTALSWVFKFKVDVPSGKDARQTAALASLTGQTNEALVLTQTGGYTVTFNAPLYTQAKLSVKANGTQQIELDGTNGSGTGVIS